MYVGLSLCGSWYVHALIIVMIIIIVLKIVMMMMIIIDNNNNDKCAYNNIAIKILQFLFTRVLIYDQDSKYQGPFLLHIQIST